ncbi:hypothetical protein SDRG_14340 [Saprolegnia diclina VS20]|uniref:Peptidase C1A papain C-terminal domain-containing protein n=1 Tax=Saprolegnia diclina (strain VS20) TaxID=1156394 RepID=T0PQZ6_SAPDV|nr:hypothetical protein SDRG_14340 [Saprolegnia diclina VS20]EQC27919.1 hypothetical protein SDRG_14340 [Saprolegnia diclina VS20]|eukprot:XP_008618684.1 hypothetical protein SDRG_14340 [Saprolegnia diclina VS20]
MKPINIMAFCLCAVGTSALPLSTSERQALQTELDAWKRSAAGKAAAEHGYVPKTESGELGGKNLELERFAATKKVVAQLNKANPHATFTEKNPFALLSDAEFARFATGLGNTTTPARALTVDGQLTPLQRTAAGVDWSADACMSGVRDQGACGSCWAFASVGAAEFAQCKATGALAAFSEQQLVSCASSAGYGCQGGWPNKALDYLTTAGACAGTSYPYASGNSRASGQCDSGCSKQKLRLGASVSLSGESALQSALEKQVVTVTVEANNDVWRNYQSGVVTQCPGASSDHAVVAVGYGSENGVDFFKIKNSWGGAWGDAGYMKLQRDVGGKGMCNLAANGAYAPINGGASPRTKHKPTHKPHAPSKAPCSPSPMPSTSPVPSTPYPSPAPYTPAPIPTEAPSDDPSEDPSDPTEAPSDGPTDEPLPDWPTDSPYPQPSSNPTPAPTPAPTTLCEKCKGCWAPETAGRQGICLSADYDKKYCLYLTKKLQTVWCGDDDLYSGKARH